MNTVRYRVLSLVFSVMVVMLPGIAHSVTAEDGFDPDADGAVECIAVQADGKVLIGGAFTTIGGVARNRITRLNPDGSIDPGFSASANGGSVQFIAVQADGKVLIGGAFTTIGVEERNRIARLNQYGSLDTGFNPDPNDSVDSIAVQEDNKILIGGTFTRIGGVGGQTRNHIARLKPDDGSLDEDFDPDADGAVYAIAVQADNKILIGGTFTTIGGETRNRIARLKPNGTLDTGFNNPPININGRVDSIAVQADGKILIGGVFTIGGVGITYIARLKSDGTLDTGFNPDPNDFVHSIAVQADGTILIGGLFTRICGVEKKYIARLKPDGSRDIGFGPNVKYGAVNSIAVQADGTILIGGGFTTIGGETRNRIARLHPDGSVDTVFNPVASGSVYAIAVPVRAEGSILIGGAFTTIGGVPKKYIARLYPGGTLHTGYGNPDADDTVYSIAVDAEGMILIGGKFDTIGGFNTIGEVERHNIARLNPDGTVDTTFNPDVNDTVYSIAVDAEGMILIGGKFTRICGEERKYIARLRQDGSLDPYFTGPNITITSGGIYAIALQAEDKILIGGEFHAYGRHYIARLNSNGTFDTGFVNLSPGALVCSIAVDADGKILIGGAFTRIGGEGRKHIVRLNPVDGSLDPSFIDPNINGIVYSIALQADNNILIGGEFDTIGEVERNNIARLNPNGSLDTGFDPDASSLVDSIAVQADGKILIGGQFSFIGGVERMCIARVTNTDAALQELSVSANGSKVTWMRGGASPEVWRVTFEDSPDGVTWTTLGDGQRITGGWEMTGLSLPLNQNHYVRARGYARGGQFCASDSLFESVRIFYLKRSWVMRILSFRWFR